MLLRSHRQGLSDPAECSYSCAVGAGNQRRLLYHFADADSAEVAIAVGEIMPRALLLGGMRGKREVVWLTEAPEVGAGALPIGAAGPVDNPDTDGLVRFTVAVDDAQHWRHWAARHKVRGRARRALEDRGEGLSDLWWVVSRPVPSAEWLVVGDGDKLPAG
jgi:hypothetical protein